MAARAVVDFREGEIFTHTGQVIKTAIHAKIHNDLHVKLIGYMKEVKGELDGQTSDDITSLLVRLQLDLDLDPKTILVKECLQRAASIREEITYLERVSGNLDDTFFYHLTFEQCTRYGIGDKL